MYKSMVVNTAVLQVLPNFICNTFYPKTFTFNYTFCHQLESPKKRGRQPSEKKIMSVVWLNMPFMT